MASLCEDEMFHILSWLPAKSICKLMSVCKSFMLFSKETYFSMKRSQNMLLQDDTCFFVQPDIPQRHNHKIEMYPLPIEEEEPSSGVPKSFLEFLAKSSRIIASSNGLVLCRSTRSQVDQFFICNLVTQTWVPIATPTSVGTDPDFNINIFFMCHNKDQDLDDYIIIFIDKPPEWSSHLDIKVYLPKEGVWKEMERSFFIGSRDMRLEMPVYFQGALYFISDSFSYISRESVYFWPYIMAYKFESGESTMFRLPEDVTRGSHDSCCDMRIFEWGKVKSLDHSICLVRYMNYVFTIWVWLDKKSNLWERILEIRIEEMGLKKEDLRVQEFTIMNGDCLIFSTQNKVYVYDLSGQKSWRLKEICEHEWESKVCFTPYSNTLRPSGTGATNFPGYIRTLPSKIDCNFV